VSGDFTIERQVVQDPDAAGDGHGAEDDSRDGRGDAGDDGRDGRGMPGTAGTGAPGMTAVDDGDVEDGGAGGRDDGG